MHPGPDLARSAAASISGRTPAGVRPLLAELTRAHLVVEPTADRYTSHDLLRGYAAELSHTVDAEDERREVLRRMLDHYLQQRDPGSGGLVGLP